MKYIKNLTKNVLIGTISILTLSLILSIFMYFNIFTNNIFKLLIPIISLFITGILTGKKARKKGWLEGFKISIIFILIFSLINLFFIKKFDLEIIIHYTILITSCVLGSMIGINKKTNN